MGRRDDSSAAAFDPTHRVFLDAVAVAAGGSRVAREASMGEEERMQASDRAIEVLQAIRDQAEQTNLRLETTNLRLDENNGRINAMREELSRRLVESEIRTSTAITELAGTMREMTAVLRTQNDLRPRLEKCERDIADLRRALDQR
jgi:predicted ATPase